MRGVVRRAKRSREVEETIRGVPLFPYLVLLLFRCVVTKGKTFWGPFLDCLFRVFDKFRGLYV